MSQVLFLKWLLASPIKLNLSKRKICDILFCHFLILAFSNTLEKLATFNFSSFYIQKWIDICPNQKPTVELAYRLLKLNVLIHYINPSGQKNLISSLVWRNYTNMTKYLGSEPKAKNKINLIHIARRYCGELCTEKGKLGVNVFTMETCLLPSIFWIFEYLEFWMFGLECSACIMLLLRCVSKKLHKPPFTLVTDSGWLWSDWEKKNSTTFTRSHTSL